MHFIRYIYKEDWYMLNIFLFSLLYLRVECYTENMIQWTEVP